MTKSFRHSSLRADFTQFPWEFCIIGIKLLGQLFLFWDFIFLMKPLKEYLKEKKNIQSLPRKDCRCLRHFTSTKYYTIFKKKFHLSYHGLSSS